MGIFSRFADIVNSNINALLDKAEDPKKMIRLIVQEMEDTLVEVRTISAKTIADKKELEMQIERLSEDAEDWEQKAELAISKDRDDLAKAALAECNRIRETSESLIQQKAKLESQLAHLSEEVAQLQEKLDDARNRQKALLMRQQASSSRLKVKKVINDNAAESALDRFDQFERKMNELESEVESYDIGKKSSLADEINELEKQEKIDEQLQALKARVNKSKKGEK
ncbi:MAG: phage shock protein PspA [Gammaproteobacteria bacterium]|nr:phage shock protein PspA [Gammaproteobacteria bacterium]MDH5629664.1 phage shock protein PspA [Gammaproteobacteria bacterium]